MSDVVGISYHHLSASGSHPKGDNATETRLFAALNKLVAAGFTVDTDGRRLRVSPAARMTAQQREWLQKNKAELVEAVIAARWRWCVEWPDGRRCVVDFLPGSDWRQVSGEYPGAAVWPAPDGFDVAEWIGGKVAS